MNETIIQSFKKSSDFSCVYPRTIKFNKVCLDIIETVPGRNFSDKLKNLIIDYDLFRNQLSFSDRQKINLERIHVNLK